MTIHVNIGEAKTRLSELIAAAVRGEDVVLSKAGEPQVRLVAVTPASDAERERVVQKRRAAFGMWKHLVGDSPIDLDTLKMTDEEWEARDRKRFGAAD